MERSVDDGGPIESEEEMEKTRVTQFVKQKKKKNPDYNSESRRRRLSLSNCYLFAAASA